MKLIYKLAILSSLCQLTGTALADTINRGSMISLEQCNFAHAYYCVKLSGSAIKAPEGMDALPIRFDTGGERLTVPIGCVDMSQVKVLSANTKNQLRGTQAELVEGQVALTSADGQTRYHLDHFKFYAVKGQDNCRRYISAGNFGAGPMLASDPQTHAYISSFFNQYPYPQDITPGFSIIPSNPNARTIGRSALVKMGADPISSDMFSVPLQTTTTKNQQCLKRNPDDANQCIGFTDKTGFNFGYIIPNSKIRLVGPGHSPVVIDAANSLVDSGGGLTLIDDTDNSVIPQLQDILMPPPRFLPWLNTCYTLPAGTRLMYSAIDAQGHTIQYQFPVEAPKRGIQQYGFSVAICHKRKQGHWLEHGVNVGYGFFSHAKELIFRLDPTQGGAIGVVMPK